MDTKKFVKDISNKLCELVQAVYVEICPVDVFPKAMILHLVEPAGEIGNKTCFGSGKVQCK